ncbi:hypothetical protein BKA70DRAFT_1421906 [Coprinopsis sp. MPI-PUGE-AT-0042]|nr:hypothetical protein BKA70DRAFT_1421906 [Coprinopsis sp. MPI-PUGE-AT-0042]
MLGYRTHALFTIPLGVHTFEAVVTSATLCTVSYHHIQNAITKATFLSPSYKRCFRGQLQFHAWDGQVATHSWVTTDLQQGVEQDTPPHSPQPSSFSTRAICGSSTRSLSVSSTCLDPLRRSSASFTNYITTSASVSAHGHPALVWFRRLDDAVITSLPPSCCSFSSFSPHTFASTPVHATPERRSNHRPVQYQAQGRAPLELSDEPSMGHVKCSSILIAFALRILVPCFATSPSVLAPASKIPNSGYYSMDEDDVRQAVAGRIPFRNSSSPRESGCDQGMRMPHLRRAFA